MSIFDHPRLSAREPLPAPIAPPEFVQKSPQTAQAFVEQSARDAAKLLDADLFVGPNESRVRHNSRAYFRLANAQGQGLLKISTGRNFHQVEREVALGRWACVQGLAPRQTILEAPLGHVQVHEWIDAPRFAPTDEQLRAVLTSFRRLHRSELMPGLAPKVPELTRGARKHGDIFSVAEPKAPITFAELQRRTAFIDAKNDLFRSKFAMCHGDATGENVFVVDDVETQSAHAGAHAPQKKVLFIDWEDGGVGYPLHDVAKFLAMELVPKNQLDRLLQLYLERPPTFGERRYARCVMAGINLECFGYLSKELGDPMSAARAAGFREAIMRDKDLFSWRYIISGPAMSAVHALNFHMRQTFQRKRA